MATEITEEELQRERERLRSMWTVAGPDDPIYQGGFRASTVKSMPSTKDSQKSTTGATPDQARKSSAAEPNSQSEVPELPQEAIDQIYQEAKEQMGYQPEETDESDSSTGPNKKG